MFFFGNPDLMVAEIKKSENNFEILQLNQKVGNLERLLSKNTITKERSFIAKKIRNLKIEIANKEFMNIDFYDRKIKTAKNSIKKSWVKHRKENPNCKKICCEWKTKK